MYRARNVVDSAHKRVADLEKERNKWEDRVRGLEDKKWEGELPPDEDQRLAIAEAKLATAEAKLANSETKLTTAKAELTTAKAELAIAEAKGNKTYKDDEKKRLDKMLSDATSFWEGLVTARNQGMFEPVFFCIFLCF